MGEMAMPGGWTMSMTWMRMPGQAETRLGRLTALVGVGYFLAWTVAGMAMAAVGAAITAERLAPAGERVARAIGAVVVWAGVLLVARAAGLG